MNRKQIVKINTVFTDGKGNNIPQNSPWSKLNGKYAICVDEKKGILLLENGKLLKKEGESTLGMYEFPRNVECDPYNIGTIKPASISATRCVPSGVREVLEETADRVIEAFKTYEKLRPMVEEWNEKYGTDLNLRTLRVLSNHITKAQGFLTDYEFCEAVKENFSDELKTELNHGEVSTEYAERTGEWNVSFQNGKLSFEREVWINKYVNPDRYSFLYEEYDGAMMMGDEDDSYRQMCKKYRKSLPVEGVKTDEYLSVGDKRSLFYNQEMYISGIKGPLTKEYAKELADMLSGREKERDVHDESEEQER